MAANYWIKLYQEIIRDPKMGRLSDSAFRRCIELFLLAGEQDERDGSLPNVADVAWELRIDEQKLTDDLEELETAGIITMRGGRPFVVNFEKRQAATSNSERAKLWRERNRTQGKRNENEGERKTNDSFADTDIETDKDTEKSGSSSYANICRIYENEIGMLSLRVSEYLQEAVEEYSPQWIEDAIGEAVQHNARNWKYVAAILKRWKADGRANNTPSKNGHAQRNEDGSYYF